MSKKQKTSHFPHLNYFSKGFSNLDMKNSNENIGSKQQPFNEETAKALDLELELAIEITYRHQKKFYSEHVRDDVPQIGTPHPISNQSASFRTIVRAIKKIYALKIRQETSLKLDKTGDNKYNNQSCNAKLAEYLTEATTQIKLLTESTQNKSFIDTNNKITLLCEQYNKIGDKDSGLCSSSSSNSVSALSATGSSLSSVSTYTSGDKGIDDPIEKDQAILKIDEALTIESNLLQNDSLFLSRYVHENSPPQYDLLIEQLVEIALSEQIQTEIISINEQSTIATIKEKKFPKGSKSWVNADADGDTKNPIGNKILPGIEGKTILEIYNHCKASNYDTGITRELRISCEDKKNVTGINTQISKIPGVQDITSWDDLLEQENFNLAYDKFKIYLEATKYTKQPSQNGSKEDYLVNSPLEIIIRIASPVLFDSDGLVLSDFNPTIMSTLPALRFINLATAKYLSEKTHDTITIAQKILPLSENREAIEGQKDSFNTLLSSLDKKIKSGKEEDIKRARNILCSSNQEEEFSCIGFFPGPSDATKRIGGQSTFIMRASMDAIIKLWKKFITEHSSLNLQNVKLIKEYGIGTAERRRTSVPFPFAPITDQGFVSISEPSYAKNRSRTISAQSMEIPISSLSEQEIKFNNLGIDHYNYMWGDSGIVTENFDIIKSQPLWTAMQKQFANNAGTRGKEGELKTIPETRAIGANSIAVQSGLMYFQAYPSPENLKSFDKGFFLSLLQKDDPINISTFIGEMFQIVGHDSKRAEMMGFTKEVIEEDINYVDAVLDKLYNDLDITRDNEESYKGSVKKLISLLLEREFVKDDIFRKNILLNFRDQINYISKISEILTVQVFEASNEQKNDKNSLISDKSLANIAFTNGIYANLKAPLIGPYKLKEDALNKQDRSLWVEKISDYSQEISL